MPCSQQTTWTELNSSSEHVYCNGSVHTESQQTELTCTKLTLLHDAWLVTRVSVTKLIGCSAQFVNSSSRTAVQFSSVRLLWTRLYCPNNMQRYESSQSRRWSKIASGPALISSFITLNVMLETRCTDDSLIVSRNRRDLVILATFCRSIVNCRSKIKAKEHYLNPHYL